jgi:two-component system, chemotaxis family, CheB/CheR fusion protein
MAREGLRIPLRTALHKASRQRAMVLHPGLRILGNGSVRIINLKIEPLDKEKLPGMMLVVFEDVTPPKVSGRKGKKEKRLPEANRQVMELEQELNATKETLQATLEQLETSNEELKSANEELQATNEELQSTNEELETSKEELQSINEELMTVNAELQSKVDELSESDADMSNLLNSTKIGTLFLDDMFRIKRFTPAATQFFHLIPGDIGRPLSDFASTLTDSKIVEDAEEVLRTLIYKEREIQAKTGAWYLMRILPYRTQDNKIQGTVMTFVNITDLKKQKLIAEGIFSTIHEPLLVLDKNLKVVSSNPAFHKTFQVEKEKTEGRFLYDLGNGQWNIPSLRKLLGDILPQRTSIEDFEVDHNFEHIGRRKMSLNARRIVLPEEDQLILMAMRDVTDSLSENNKDKED